MLKVVSRLLTTSAKMPRGALIVLEGCDRCGKTTQCKKLVASLNNDGVPAEMMVFPDRSTAIGAVISDYLERKCELEDHAIHLLFAANRWELLPRMKKLLESGTTLIVDRYSFSGVAFSAAKPTLDLEWCREPEKGLLRPDAVLYLTLSPEEAAKRSQYGGERYEETTFQTQVASNYQKLYDNNWQTIDASKTIEDLQAEIKEIVLGLIEKSKDHPLESLWCESRQKANGLEAEAHPPIKKSRVDCDAPECDSPTLTDTDR